MKLNPDSIAYILNVARTAKMVGIDNIIIEPGTVRAMDEARTVVIFQDTNVPNLEFNSIGINRIDVLMARYEIASNTDNFVVEFATKDDNNTEFVYSLTFKGKGTKVEYRCADPSKINAPKSINDTLAYAVKLNPEAVTLMQKGAAAMGADTVSIISNEGVSFEFVDINNDVFKHTFTNDVEIVTDDVTSTKFAHRYPVKTLLSLFKNNPEGTLYIGKKGILSFEANQLTVFVLPQV